MRLLPLQLVSTTTQQIPDTTSVQENQKIYTWHRLSWVFIGLGITLRLFHYLVNRSLWIDEIYLSSSLIRMNFQELATSMLDYEQKAPIGFLWLVKLSLLAFGKSEYTLRLVPLLAGIASLFLFLPVSKYFLKPFGAALAMGMLTLAPPIIYHSVEIKQYITEALATILCLYFYIRFHNNYRLKGLFMWGFVGALILWFSFAAIFILAGMAIAICLSLLLQKKWKELFLLSVPFSMWLISFAINYLFFTSRHAEAEWLKIWFNNRHAFMPLPPTSLADLLWFPKTAYLFLQYPLGLLWHSNNIDNQVLRVLLKMTVLPIAFLALGLGVIWSKNRTILTMFLFPTLLVLLASGLKLYPFYERLLVFLAPIYFIIIAAGADRAVQLLPTRLNWRYLFVSLVLLGPLITSAQQAFNPMLFGYRKNSNHRDALLYIQERARPGDVVYLNWNSITEYKFYNQLYRFKFKTILGRDVRAQSGTPAEYFQNLQPDFNQMAQHKRAWIYMNRHLGLNIGDVEPPVSLFDRHIKDGRLFKKKMSALGKHTDTYKGHPIHVYLFDFSKGSNAVTTNN